MDDETTVQMQVHTFGEHTAGNENLRKQWRVERQQESAPRLRPGLAVDQSHVRQPNCLATIVVFGCIEETIDLGTTVAPSLDLIEGGQVLGTLVVDASLS